MNSFFNAELSLEQLCSVIDKLSDNQRLLFREILIIDHRITGHIYSSFFDVENRVGGESQYIYVDHLCDRLNLQRNEVLHSCIELLDMGLIEELDLTDKAFRTTETVISLVNKYHSSILERLYSPAERSEPLIPNFHGGVKYKDGKPYYFYDIDLKPLNGRFMLEKQFLMKDGVYEFNEGKLLTKIQSDT